MKKTKLIVGCALLLLPLCLTNVMGQQSAGYPQNAGDIISLVETFNRIEFSVNDAVEKFGTAKRDDKVFTGDGSFVLTPFASNRTLVKKVVLDVFESKPDRVNIEYIKPILISYGSLKEKYGAPRYRSPPVMKCKRGVDCQPRFVGYSFDFLPKQKNMISGKWLEVVVDLMMQWSKEVPQHTEKDFLAVTAIQVRRVWRD